MLSFANPTKTVSRPGLKLAWLRSFAVLVEQGNWEKAAQALKLSPASLRRNLMQLENHLQVCLLIELGESEGALSLTPTGEDLYKQAQALLAVLANDGNPLLVPSPELPVLRLGLTSPYLLSTFQDLVGHFSEPLPPHHLIVQTFGTEHSWEDLLLQKQIDLLIGTQAPLSPALASLTGKSSPYCIAAATQFPQPLAKWRFALLANTGECPHWLKPAQIVCQASELGFLLEMAKSDLCALYLPECLIQAELAQGSLVKIAEPPEPADWTPYLCWLPDPPWGALFSSP